MSAVQTLGKEQEDIMMFGNPNPNREWWKSKQEV